MGRATARAPLEKVEALNVPLFRELVERLESAGRRIILDLGAASTPMLAVLGRGRCRVEIADLASDDGVALLNAAPADERATLAESLLPAHAAGEPLDLVFCWDLPNYLAPEATSALMRAVAARSAPDALAHALIVYSERSMPDHPGRFVPTDDCRLVDRAPSSAEIAAPRYSPEALGRIMSPFGVDRARLLANGMQEFLFRL